MITKTLRGFEVVDLPCNQNALGILLDIAHSDPAPTHFAIVQLKATTNARQAMTRWRHRNAPSSSLIRVSGRLGVDSWLLAFPAQGEWKAFNTFLHTKHPHAVLWRGDNLAAFVLEASRQLTLGVVGARYDVKLPAA
ncbi:hypothetical protein [Pseudomonas oryzihabitans]|uniref:hypothetical protein n=1 Tax=Pseudomonas oryzihabitans TaxID=47885 RepID=UPI003F9778C1